MDEVNDPQGNSVPNRLSRRRVQALETRRLIVKAAQTLFLSRGYIASTMDAIAAEAGVAVSTVYFAFGSKLAILRAVREDWHERSQVKQILGRSRHEKSPAKRLKLLAEATTNQWDTGPNLITIYTQAASANAEAAAELEAALSGRRAALDEFTRDLASVVPGSFDADRAAAVVRALCRFEVYQELVLHSGWTPEQYRRWLGGALISQLLD